MYFDHKKPSMLAKELDMPTNLIKICTHLDQLDHEYASNFDVGHYGPTENGYGQLNRCRTVYIRFANGIQVDVYTWDKRENDNYPQEGWNILDIDKYGHTLAELIKAI